jgi:uncharacterized protein YndB with AHSA1/START domain
MRLQRSIDISVSPDKTWPFLVEPDKILKWFTLLRIFEYTGLKHSGVGSTFYYEEKSGPQLMKLNYVVTEWVDNKRLVFVLTSGPLKKDSQVWSLEAITSGSRFTMTEDVVITRGIIDSIITPILKGMIGKNLEKIQRNLKELIETQV